MQIQHPYPEIAESVAGYNSPEHKYTGKFSNMEIYNTMRDNIVFDLINEYPASTRRVTINNDKTKEVVFDAEVSFPAFWSEMSATIFASKYLIRNVEYSLYQAVSRVVCWIAVNGVRSGHINEDDCYQYAMDLGKLIVEQKATFNSPVWFNVCSTDKDPFDNPMQTNACFVNKIKDDMGTIIGQNVINQMIALGGSGSGVDMTPIRSRKEWIGKQQGRPSGPVGFTVMFDAILQATRSAGRFRRAAGLVSLKQHHQDIMDFVNFKVIEEDKGRCLAENMEEWDNSFAAEGQLSIFGTLKVQNVNTAVRITEEFWKGYEDGSGTFPLRDRFGHEVGRMNCDELLTSIASAQLKCGDPGLQFDDNVNDWNPFLLHDETMRFNSSNACAEYQFLDDSACNLASLNITKFFDFETLTLDTKEMERVIDLFLTAQDIIIDFSYYPSAAIAKTSYEARSVGLNYGDIGNLLFKHGLPYDSDEARYVVSCLTSLFTAYAYKTSCKIAEKLGAFKLYAENEKVQEGMRNIIAKHRNATGKLVLDGTRTTLTKWSIIAHNALDIYNDIIKNRLPIRNATVTVFVPQGTVGLAQDQKTTGIEPFIFHGGTKDLVGGGKLDFCSSDADAKTAIINHERIYGTNNVCLSHLFQTAIGDNTIDPIGHVLMLAAAQPFISLAISKTCNMPATTTVEDIVNIYKTAHSLGVKCVTIYVDGSKVLQPLKGNKKIEDVVADKPKAVIVSDPSEVILRGWTVQLGIDKFYIKFGFNPSNPDMIWEIWVEQSFCGGTVDGMAKTLAVMVSRELQEGIRHGKYNDVKASIVKSLAKMTFPPNGFIGWPKGQPQVFNDIHSAQSLPNLLAQMLSSFPDIDADVSVIIAPPITPMQATNLPLSNAPICTDCGRQMFKSGGSSKCFACTCGKSVGGCG